MKSRHRVINSFLELAVIAPFNCRQIKERVASVSDNFISTYIGHRQRQLKVSEFLYTGLSPQWQLSTILKENPTFVSCKNPRQKPTVISNERLFSLLNALTMSQTS